MNANALQTDPASGKNGNGKSHKAKPASIVDRYEHFVRTIKSALVQLTGTYGGNHVQVESR